MAEDGELLSRLVGGELRGLLRLLDGSDIEELEVELGDTKLAFRRDLATASLASPGDEPAAAPAQEPTGTTIAAERVGFFHFPDGSRPSPGDTVKAGQVVGVVDSLNVPTPITAPGPGRLAEVLVEDGQPVEYGQPLFVIEPEE